MLADFNDIPSLILILLLGAIFYSSYHVLSSYFTGSGQPEKSGYCQIPALIGSLMSYPILAPHLGALGAAIGSSLSYFLMYLMITWLFSKNIRPEKSQLFRFRLSDVTWILKQIKLLLKKISLKFGL